MVPVDRPEPYCQTEYLIDSIALSLEDHKPVLLLPDLMTKVHPQLVEILAKARAFDTMMDSLRPPTPSLN